MKKTIRKPMKKTKDECRDEAVWAAEIAQKGGQWRALRSSDVEAYRVAVRAARAAKDDVLERKLQLVLTRDELSNQAYDQVNLLLAKRKAVAGVALRRPAIQTTPRPDSAPLRPKTCKKGVS